MFLDYFEDGLPAFEDIANDVGRKERETDQLLYAAVRGVLAGCDLGESLSGLDPAEELCRTFQ
ncbi:MULTISPECIES: hypothetical protein [unclassified Roseovarius]|uniref:hypothetical protein n=1 Tax=unclassified Roseovarius TaxID=2614913 RepID=UPI00273D9C2E|nr:hypothetical protein [Roseovarius sp. MMSF_3350]